MYIHWDSETRTYDNARDAAQELRRRAHHVATPGCSATEAGPRDGASSSGYNLAVRWGEE